MAAANDFSRLGDDTQLIEVSENKMKYINKNFKKVTAKMYDHHCDIKLQVGNETFRAHKAVLSEASMYFEAMFSHNMREKEQEAIELHEISPPGFSAMMEYFYHGHITVTVTSIADIVEAARFFHIEWLLNICCNFLVKHLSIENYNSTLELADKYYLGDLREDIFQFITLNFIVLAKEDKFLHASFEILQIILEENFYIEASEGFIFETLLRWFEYDKEGREKHKKELLDLVRFPLLDSSELESIPDDVKKWPEIEAYIQEALTYHEKPYAQCLLATEKTEARGSVEALVLVDAIEDAQHFQYKVPGYPGFLKEAIDTSFMDSVFEFASVTVLGNFLFVAGGYDRRNYCSSPAFYHYDPRHRCWAQLQSMLRPRVSFPLCASDTGIYAVAGVERILPEGRDIENLHNTVEFYNPLENTWEFLPEMSFGMFNCAACVHSTNGNLYITGGISSDPEDNVPVNYLQAFLAKGRRTWVPLAPMLTPRHAHAMVSHDNKLFALGGFTDCENTITFDDCYINEVYDIEVDQWSRVKSIPLEFGHWHNAATTMDDKIYVLGGKGSEQMRFLYSYSSKEDEISEGEYCGQCVQKISLMKIPIPKFLLDGGHDT